MHLSGGLNCCPQPYLFEQTSSQQKLGGGTSTTTGADWWRGQHFCFPPPPAPVRRILTVWSHSSDLLYSERDHTSFVISWILENKIPLTESLGVNSALQSETGRHRFHASKSVSRSFLHSSGQRSHHTCRSRVLWAVTGTGGRTLYYLTEPACYAVS